MIKVKKILLVAGHGAGDPGATAKGRKEATETRKVVKSLYNRLKDKREVVVYDMNKNLYRSKDHSKYKGYEIIEIHFNAFLPSAKGAEVLIKKGFRPDAMDKAILAALARYWINRGFKYRSNLANMNKFARIGASYRLVEVCFISNKSDMAVYDEKYDAFISALAEAIQKDAKKKTTTTTTTTTTVQYYKHFNNKSIVDGLKSIGVDSSMRNRKRIAAANGMKHYIGLGGQNRKLLDLARNGRLKKA